MSLLAITDKKYIIPDLQSSDKKGVIEELVDLLNKAGKVKDKQKAIEGIMEREKKSSTGLEKGIAVPHAKTPAVKKLIMAIGISKKGIDFNAIDGKKSYLFFLLLSPPDSAGPHVTALASIARLITPPEIREKLKNTRSADDILNIIQEHESQK